MGVKSRKERIIFIKKKRRVGVGSENNRSRMNECRDIRAEPLNDYWVLIETLTFFLFFFFEQVILHTGCMKRKIKTVFFHRYTLLYSLRLFDSWYFRLLTDVCLGAWREVFVLPRYAVVTNFVRTYWNKNLLLHEWGNLICDCWSKKNIQIRSNM